MAITIALADFDQHRERYRNLRMKSLNHQPSGVLANERDLNLFWQYFNDNSVEKITGDCILRAITWLHEERNMEHKLWQGSYTQEYTFPSRCEIRSLSGCGYDL